MRQWVRKFREDSDICRLVGSIAAEADRSRNRAIYSKADIQNVTVNQPCYENILLP